MAFFKSGMIACGMTLLCVTLYGCGGGGGSAGLDAGCDEGSPGACTKCSDGYEIGVTAGVCVFKCKRDSTQKHCTTCVDENTCATCENDYGVVGGKCEFKCTDLQSANGCKFCADRDTCTECVDGFESDGLRCSFKLTEAQKSAKCTSAIKADQCTACEIDHVLHTDENKAITCGYNCTSNLKAGSPCEHCVADKCTKCKASHTLANGECEFNCNAAQTTGHCTKCSSDIQCTDCQPGYHVAGTHCEFTCTRAETAKGCKRCDGPGRCLQCLVRWVWHPNYTCSQVTGPTYQEFYTYRATNSFKYDPNGINTASAGGVMRYIHEEVVGLDCCAPQCKRKYEIDRVRRYKIKQKTTEGAYSKGRGQFGIFHQYDKAQCTWGGVGKCLEEYQKAGWYVGCQNQHVDHFFYEDSVWLSFPGLCPSQPYWLKTADCYLKEPGGNCSGCIGNNDACGKHPNGTIICGCNDFPMGGCQADNVTACVEKYFGEDDCTFLLEDAGEVLLNDLVGITDMGYASDQTGYEHFCLEGGVEHMVNDESQSTIPFWKGRKDVQANSQRTYLLMDAFAKKYPDSPYLGEPACEH